MANVSTMRAQLAQRIEAWKRGVAVLAEMLAKKNVKLVFRGRMCCTTGNTIFLPEVGLLAATTNLTKEQVEEREALLDAMMGHLDHEAGHVLFTDFAVKNTMATNCLEDLRIEKKMRQFWPGSQFNLNRSSTYVFNKWTKEEVEKLTPAMQILLGIGFAGRAKFEGGPAHPNYRANIPVPARRFIESREVQSIIRKTIDAENTAEVSRLAKRLVELMKKWKDKEEEKPPEQQKQPKQKSKPQRGGEDSEPQEGEDEDQTPLPPDDTQDEEEPKPKKSRKKKVKEPEPEEDEQEDESEGGGSEGDEDGEEDEQEGSSGSGGDEDESEDGDDSESGEGGEDGDDDESESGGSEGDDEDDSESSSAGSEGGEDEDGDEVSASPENDVDDEDAVRNDTGAPPETSPDPNSPIGKDRDPDDVKFREDLADEMEQPEEELAKKAEAVEDAKVLADQVPDPMNVNLSHDSYLIYTTEDDVIEPPRIDPSREEELRAEYHTIIEAVGKDTLGVVQRSLQNFLKARSMRRDVRDLDEGKIDRNRLYRMVLPGDANRRVFKQNVEQLDLTNVVVALWMNQSGSMGSKVEITQQTTAAFAEVLSALNIPFEVCGHTTGHPGAWNRLAHVPYEQRFYTRYGTLAVTVYKSFDENWMAVRHRLALFRASANTYDGEVVKLAATRILQQPQKRKVIFFMDDGRPEPNSEESQAKHQQYLQYIVPEVEKTGVEPVGVGMATASVAQFYPRHVVVWDLSKLAEVMLSELRDVLTKPPKTALPQQ